MAPVGAPFATISATPGTPQGITKPAFTARATTVRAITALASTEPIAAEATRGADYVIADPIGGKRLPSLFRAPQPSPPLRAAARSSTWCGS